MQLKEIDVFRPESLWDTARLAIGISALGALLVDQVSSYRLSLITYSFLKQ
jgi:calcium-independent phospholipase A2